MDSEDMEVQPPSPFYLLDLIANPTIRVKDLERRLWRLSDEPRKANENPDDRH